MKSCLNCQYGWKKIFHDWTIRKHSLPFCVYYPRNLPLNLDIISAFHCEHWEIDVQACQPINTIKIGDRMTKEKLLSLEMEEIDLPIKDLIFFGIFIGVGMIAITYFLVISFQIGMFPLICSLVILLLFTLLKSKKR
jgi:hypothetical protein